MGGGGREGGGEGRQETVESELSPRVRRSSWVVCTPSGTPAPPGRAGGFSALPQPYELQVGVLCSQARGELVRGRGPASLACSPGFAPGAWLTAGGQEQAVP